MPRPRPPFPAQAGIDEKPTNINNVETLANIPLIIKNGAEWYGELGTDASKGTKIFSLAGKVNNTGLVEVPIGTTIREVVYDIGGGIPKGRQFKAVQMGGPAGGCVPARFLNLPIDYDTIQRIAREGQCVVPTNITYDRLAKTGADYGLPEESISKIADVREAGLERLAKMHKAGVTVGYGSDLLGGMQPHQSGEFPLRGEYIPTDAVIRSATVDAAKVLRMEGELGVIAPGAHADLIVVNGNPLDDLNLLTEQGAHMPLIMQGGVAKKKETGL
jgi:hypothetical protein